MNNIEFADRLAKMWQDSRKQSGKSQDYVAKALGVSKKTIQNWEAGIGSPNFRTSIEWFECLGVPMYPYLMALIYPDEIEGITADTNMADLRKALHIYIDELDDFHIRELLFLLHGSHGSSPTGTIDLITAYLHLPMAMRICITNDLLLHYEIAEQSNLLRDKEHIMPRCDTIAKCFESAKEAVYSGKETYTLVVRDEQ